MVKVALEEEEEISIAAQIVLLHQWCELSCKLGSTGRARRWLVVLGSQWVVAKNHLRTHSKHNCAWAEEGIDGRCDCRSCRDPASSTSFFMSSVGRGGEQTLPKWSPRSAVSLQELRQWPRTPRASCCAVAPSHRLEQLASSLTCAGCGEQLCPRPVQSACERSTSDEIARGCLHTRHPSSDQWRSGRILLPQTVGQRHRRNNLTPNRPANRNTAATLDGLLFFRSTSRDRGVRERLAVALTRHFDPLSLAGACPVLW